MWPVNKIHEPASFEERHAIEMQEINDFLDSGVELAELKVNPEFARGGRREQYRRVLRIVAAQRGDPRLFLDYEIFTRGEHIYVMKVRGKLNDQ